MAPTSAPTTRPPRLRERPRSYRVHYQTGDGRVDERIVIRPGKLTARQAVEQHLRGRFAAGRTVRYRVMLNHASAQDHEQDCTLFSASYTVRP